MKTHQMSNTKLYKVWVDMKSRCLNPNDTGFKNWGGRGITICEAWMTFEGFYAWAAPLWQKYLQLDREDNDGNYCPENCWFTTKSFQSVNKRAYFTNSSGIAGVSWCGQKRKWRCRITIDGKEKHLGFFVNLDDAKVSRSNAVSEYKAMLKAAPKPTDK